MNVLGSDVLLFEDFRLDRRGLFRRDEAGTFIPVKIGSRALDILRILIERAGELVAKDEIIAVVWPETVVEEGNLTMQVSLLRRVLDQGRPQHSCIQTVPGRGYRFVAKVIRDGADSGAPGAPANALGRSPRLSIVVLPFVNLSGDPAQQYFADGVTEDVTTDLSRLADMFVISRNTAFTYRNKSIDTRQIGRELGVHYVLEGAVRRSGDQIRVTAQLIDAERDAHLWAERFDREMGDLFALQSEITSRIAVALNLELVAAEAARPTDNPDALDYILRGRALMTRPWSRDSYAAAIGALERAAALDPRSIAVRCYLSYALAARVNQGSVSPNPMTDTPAQDVERAAELVTQALAASPRDPLAHFAKGEVLRAQGRFAEAIPEYETALASNSNWLTALSHLAFCKFWSGSVEEMIPLHEQLIRLSPRDPGCGQWYFRIGLAHLLQSRVADAIPWLEKARAAHPTRRNGRAALAAAYGLNGDTERASAELAAARALVSDDRFSSVARVKAVGWFPAFPGDFGAPKTRALFEATYFAGLRKAGMPEE